MHTNLNFWALVNEQLFIRLDDLIQAPVYVKLEGYNPAGSIKIKTALSLIEAAESSQHIKPDSILIESSSGNLGIAIAMIAAARRYQFVCVVDPNAALESTSLIKAFGAKVVVVNKRDENGGYLNSRISYIKDILSSDSRFVWLNQYANPANPAVHERTTAASLLAHLPPIDFLVVGAGTTGTLMGCARHFRRHSPKTKIIAVDSEGSVTFGAPPAVRRIPGLGMSRRPEICDPTMVDEVVFVPERDTVAMCRWFAKSYGLLLGGSTGTVLAGIRAYKDFIPERSLVATISPDKGDRYLSTIYCDDWVQQYFPDVLAAGIERAA